ncbi:MAG TPA: TetR-like C-terminal domain-containing protein [Ktedonobacterales bacterium]|jgi:AcrR family transcriptional regulator|nr:TetR-like C-terminal domain-containing protein [Ktedonobacterales bacterium]
MARISPRPGLDEAAVLRAAAEIVDHEGWETLTLARLASDLDVRTPSLYNHIAGLEGLRSGLATMGARELRDRLARSVIGKSGEEAIFALAEAYRRLAYEHPGLYAASLRAPRTDEPEYESASTEILTILHAVLARYRLDDVAEVHAIRALRSMLHGFISLELAGGFGMPVNIEESFHVLVRLFIIGLERAAQQSEAPVANSRED